jgi:hypothetical protein
LLIDISNIPAGQDFHLRGTSTLAGFVPLTPPFNFDSTTVFPTALTVAPGVISEEFYQVWTGLSPILAGLPYSEDFEADDGGFTAASFQPFGVSGGPWTYGAGAWTAAGSGTAGSPFEQLLTSPEMIVPANGAVTLAFDQAYNYEADWDGGVVMLSVNNGPFTFVTDFSQNGYDVALQTGADYGYAGDLNGVMAFNGDSGGVIHSVANLGSLTAGDVIRIQFRGFWDWNTAPDPAFAWSIDNVSVTQP